MGLYCSMRTVNLVLCHLLSTASSSLSYSATTTIATPPLPLPSVNDMPEEYGLIYKILLGTAGVIITITMYLGGKNIVFKFVCCSQYNGMVQKPATTSSDSNVMDILSSMNSKFIFR